MPSEKRPRPEPPELAPGEESAILPTLVWRPFLLSRIVLVAGAGWSLFLGGDFLADTFPPCSSGCLPRSAGDGVLRSVAAVALVAFAVGLISAAFTVLRVTDRDLTVRNLFWRTRTVPLPEVTGAEPGYSGLLLRLRDGQEVPCVAVQTSNWRKWFRRPGRGGAVADEILRRSGSAVRA